MSADHRIAKAAGLIALMTLLSRVLGFVRETLAGRFFSRLQTDAYFAAFVVPDFMYYLLVGGALSAAFIPVFTSYLAKGDEEDGWRAAGTFINTVSVLLLALAATGMIFARQVAYLEAPGFRQPDLAAINAATPRLDAIAAEGLGLSRHDLQGNLRKGRIAINGRVARLASTPIRAGDLIEVENWGRAKIVSLTDEGGACRITARRTGVKLSLVTTLTRIMFSSVAMLALGGLLSGVLYSYQLFLTPALGPVIYNIGIILGAVLLGKDYGIKGMAAGVVAGAAGSLSLQIWAVWRRRPPYRPFFFRFNHPGFVRMLWLMVPAFFGLSATQLNLLFTNMMASGLPEGSISALRFANRLVQLPVGIFAAAIGTAFFPAMARSVAEGKLDAYKKTLSLGLRSILFITIPAAIGLVILRYPIIRLLFEGQRFSANDTAKTAYAMGFYSLGLFAHAAILILPRAFYSLQDTRTPVAVTASTVAISLLLNLIFLRFTNLRHGGMALSFSLMGLMNMGALLFLLRRKVGPINGRAILRTSIFALLAGLVMGLAAFGVTHILVRLPALNGMRPILAEGLRVMAGVITGAAVYAFLAYLLRMEEIHILLDLIGRRFRRVKTAPEGAS